MPDESTGNSHVNSMLSAFFGTVSQRAFGNSSQRVFGSMGKQVNGLESKFKQLQNVAQSSYDVMRAGTNRAIDATESLNRKLREQSDRLRNMPKMPRPATGQPHPTTGQGRDPETGRWLPGRGVRGGGGGGGTRFGSRFSPGGGLGGISAFGGLGSVGLLFGGASVARGFSSFDANLATLQAEAGLNAEQRKGVTGNILDIAGSTQFDTQQVSSTLIAMVKDGIALKDALEQVPNVLKLAVAESTDLESAWSAMRGFVQSTNSAWSESVRLSDMMSNATSLSAAKLSDLQDIASRGLTAHSSLEAFSTEGFLAIAGILKSLNISNEVIGTGMRQFGTTIARATEGGLDPKAMAQLQARGIQFERGMTEVEALKEIQAGVQGMADTELKNFFHDVFGERAKKVFENVIPKVDELAEKMELIRKKGTVNEKFEVHAKSLTNRFKLLTSAADSFIKKFVMILNESQAFGDGIGWTTEKISQFTEFMESNKDEIQDWWGNFQEILGGVFSLAEKGIEKFSDFWSGLNDGQKTLLTIGGIILTFLANLVAGIIAAGALIVAKWQPIKSFFTRLWNDITWETAEAWTAITESAETAWNKVGDFFSRAGEVFTSPVRAAVGIAKAAWEEIKEIFDWKPIRVIREAFQPVADFFGVLAAEMKGPFVAVFDYIKAKFDWLKSQVTDLLNWLPGVNFGGKDPNALPELARLPGETDQMYKFRQMQERERLKQERAAETLQLRTLEAEDNKLNAAREQAIKRQRRLRAETTGLGGFEQYQRYVEMMKPPTADKVSKSTESYISRADTSGKAVGIAKPMGGGFDAFIGAEEEKTKARARRAIDAGLGKPEPRSMLTGSREFATDVNRAYISKAELEQFKADAKTLAMRADETQRFGGDRQSVLASAHAFGEGRADLSRVRLFDRLEREFPKLLERFYGADKEKTPVIPEAVLSGDETAFTQWTQRLTARASRQDARAKTPSTYTALGGFDRGGITADMLLNRERDQKQALKGLEATRVIRFPKLDDSQYNDLSDMFRSGFLSLVDVNSAILSELQSQTRLLGGEMVDLDLPIIRPQADSGFDDLLENRLRLAREPESEGGRVTPTGQRIEIGDNRGAGTGNITIEKIEIHADSDKSARDIARAVLAEIEKEMRARNF